jgi:hypothetical protein
LLPFSHGEKGVGMRANKDDLLLLIIKGRSQLPNPKN